MFLFAGITLIGDLHAEPEGHDALEVIALDLPAEKELLEERLKGLTEVEAIRQEILQFYRDAGRPFVSVAHEGDLKFFVVEARVGEVRGERTRYLGVNPGEPVLPEKLAEGVRFMNRNPFRRSEIVYSAGQEFGTTDVEVVTRDAFPAHFYSGIDNSGVASLGHNRVFAGFQWGNLWGQDHELSGQFTATPNFARMKALTLSYTIPLSWHHTMKTTLSGALVEVPVGQKVHTQGNTGQMSFRYLFPFLQELCLGFDFKYSNNNLLFEDTRSETISSTVLSQVVVGSSFFFADFSFKGEVAASPGSIFPNQTAKAYGLSRKGASPTYAVLRGEGTYKKNFFSIQMRGQWASATLLPSEEMGLGGVDSVRGYQERTYNADHGVIVNSEVETPALELWKGDLCAIAFLDFAWGGQHSGDTSKWLLGTGPGLRYQMGRYVQMRGDLGLKLHTISQGPNPWLHFGVVATY